MESAWMGRYRPLIAALVFHGNNVARTQYTRIPMKDDIVMTQVEWQILEYLLENEQDDECMSRISERLGIPQSSLSKAVKTLCGFGLVERFRRGRNRKNVILRPTQKGMELYREQVPRLLERNNFRAFFEALSQLDDEELASITKAVRLLSNGIDGTPEPTLLIPLDPGPDA